MEPGTGAGRPICESYTWPLCALRMMSGTVRMTCSSVVGDSGWVRRCVKDEKSRPYLVRELCVEEGMVKIMKPRGAAQSLTCSWRLSYQHASFSPSCVLTTPASTSGSPPLLHIAKLHTLREAAIDTTAHVSNTVPHHFAPALSVALTLSLPAVHIVVLDIGACPTFCMRPRY